MSLHTHNEDDEASTTSLTSEESHEPYFNTLTGAIVTAREAWHVLSKHDDRYKAKLNKKAVRPSSGGGAAPKATSDIAPAINQESDENAEDQYQSSSVPDTAPSQSSIDRALHPDLPSPPKQKVDADHPSLLDEVDQDILRAEAMALSASGQKLTPEQILLIARPDVQQQKLIEETRRKAAQAQLAARQSGIKQMGADFKKFVEKEQKNVMEWGSEMGKLIEETGFKLTSGEEKKVECTTATPRTPGEEQTSMERLNSNGSAKSSEDNNITKPSLWSSMPALPTLQSPFPMSKPAIQEDARISAVLWKRRSGFGKHSTLKAWERRLVELRGNKLMYYASPDEEDLEHREESKRKSSLFEQAASTAEHRLQSLGNDLSRMVQAAGIELLPSNGPGTPRGVLDIVKENATVAASFGHSGSPTPFCISVKVKSETKWKFCMESHEMLMQWLGALTDVVVKASVDAAREDGECSQENSWEMHEYSIQLKNEESSREITGVEKHSVGGRNRESSVRSSAPLIADIGSDGTLEWALSGQNLKIAWVGSNIALLLARSSALSIERYWWIVVLGNFGVWQLCTRSIDPSKLLRASKKVGIEDRSMTVDASMEKSTTPMAKVIPGCSCIKVSSVTDPNVTESGRKLPTWMSVSSSSIEVRSHGYLTTKKKIPSPGELYECFAVDCFQSDACYTDIASRVVLPKPDDGDKRWKSPDLFVVSITIPTEAPKFSMGQATSNEGPGTTIIGYFKMKKSTREILQRITADDYDPSSIDESEVDVQKRITNGVRLWEQYCKEAPSDSSFQGRFKLVPSLNMNELGCPAYISKYNGKPVLIKRSGVTGFFSDYPSLNAMQFDISLHPFPYLFKQAMAYLKESYFDKAVGTFGFVIEGRDDDELPEVVIGAMKVCYPNPEYVATSEEFFGGGLNR